MTALTLQMRRPPEHMSHSQATSFLSCGEQYRLEKVVRVPQVPGWALVGGSALHLATEYYDFAEAGLDRPRQEVRGSGPESARSGTDPGSSMVVLETQEPMRSH